SLTQFSSQAFRSALHLSQLLEQSGGLVKEFESLASVSLLKNFWPALAQKKLSGELRHLERWSAFLSVEAHPIIFLALNSLSPWSVFFGYLLERERKKLSFSADL